MAVTSIWPISGNVSNVINYVMNPEKTVDKNPEAIAALHAIKDMVEYAADELKTEHREYVTCLNCMSEETAAQDFMETKRLWGKLDGRSCFHGYQSFKAGEVDAKTAHEIGVKLAEKLWGDRFQVVIATHCNTGHYHNHFVISSVSYADGYHFDNRPEDYRAMREISDELCRQYGLSVIDRPKGNGKNYGEQLAERQGRLTVRGMIRQDIDRAIAASLTRREFFSFLQKAGYELKLFQTDGEELEHPGLKPPGAKGFFRFYKLGSGYDLDEIYDRILANTHRVVPFPEEERSTVAKYRYAHVPPIYDRKTSSLFRLYLRYSYELHIISRHPTSVKRVSIFMWEDLMKLDRLDAETRLLAKHQISTGEELTEYRKGLLCQIQTLEAERSKLRNDRQRYTRQRDQIMVDSVRSQIVEKTSRLRELRKEVSLCEEIALRSAKTKEELEWLMDQQEVTGKEEKTDELLRGRSGAGRPYEPGGR